MAEQEVQTKKGAKRSFVGIVTSDKMEKTIVVSIIEILKILLDLSCSSHKKIEIAYNCNYK